MNDMRKLIKLAESIPFGGGERCPDCYGAGHYEGEDECPRCEGFGEIYPDDSFHSEFAMEEDCDETPEQGEDGECSPFTHADDNVAMVREEGDEEDDYHEAEVRRFMDMGKRDLWILYNDTVEANDPADHDALQHMHYALIQMGVHVAEGVMDEDFLIPPKDKDEADRQDAIDRFPDNYADDMEDLATTGPDFEDDEDDHSDDWMLAGGEDQLSARSDRDMSDSEPFESGPGDEERDSDPDVMVDVGDDEDYEEFDFDDEFDKMMGNTHRFDEKDVMEMNELRKAAGLNEKTVVTKADIEAAGGVVKGPASEITGGPGTSTRHDGSDQVEIRAAKSLPNFRQWWDEDPQDIMSMIYWQKGQLPPSDEEAFAREWEKVKANLTKRFGEAPVEESTDSSDDTVAFDFNDEKAYYLVADEIGDRISFGMHDEILVPEQYADGMIALLTDHGFESGKAYSVAGMEEDLQNGYNDRAMTDGDDYFPKGATSSPARELGPAGAKHGDNPMRTPMASVDKEEEVYESYKQAYRRFRTK